MPAYVPNATQTTEPVESRTVESAALEFRTLKSSINSRIADLEAKDDLLDAEIDAVEVRTLALEQLAFNGSTPGTVVVQRFVTDAIETAFTLGVTPVTVAAVDAYINGVYQNHDTFSVSGNVVTFSESPAAGILELQVSVPLQIGVTTADAVEYTPAGTGAVATTVQAKLRETVSVKDFGAVGDGASNDTLALAAAVTYINSIPLSATPVGFYFPAGTYTTSASLAFTRPVYIYADGDATINFTGGATSAIQLGPNGITGFDVFLQGEYTVEGLRFKGGANALYGIYINDYVIEPRIRNCTFEDYGNSSSYDIYSQFEVWNILIENCRKFTYSSLTAVGNFIAITGRNKTNTAYDGGNSRVTIRDCWMTSYSNQELGYFAYVNAVESRIIGGGFQHSRGGILLGPVANATLIDGVYAELSTNVSPNYISVYGSTEGSLTSAQNVKVRNGYINMHQEVIGSAGRMIATQNANARLIGWNVENMTVANFVNAQPLVVQNDVTGQTGNTYKNIRPMFVPLSTDDGRRFALRGSYTNAEAWASIDVETGSWTPSVGGTATYTIQTGSYSKVGNLVTAFFDLHINAIGTGSQSAISGLPYANGPKTAAGSVGYFNTLATSVVSLNLRVDGSQQNLTLTGLTAAANGTAGTLNVLGSASRVIGSITYAVS